MIVAVGGVDCGVGVVQLPRQHAFKGYPRPTRGSCVCVRGREGVDTCV